MRARIPLDFIPNAENHLSEEARRISSVLSGRGRGRGRESNTKVFPSRSRGSNVQQVIRRPSNADLKKWAEGD